MFLHKSSCSTVLIHRACALMLQGSVHKSRGRTNCKYPNSKWNDSAVILDSLSVSSQAP